MAEKMMRFKLLRGKAEIDGKRYHFRDNPIIETTDDLVGKFNFPGSRKFARMPDSGPLKTVRRGAGEAEVLTDQGEEFSTASTTASSTGITVTATELNNMTKAQLEEFALDHDIDIEGMDTKREILDKVRADLGI